MNNIAILGSTGSVGTQALDIVRNHSDKLNVVALSANTNIEILKKQINEFKPSFVAVSDKKSADELKNKIEIPLYSGVDANLMISKSSDYDTLLNCVVGLAGIRPTLTAIEHKKNIAIANKETLVAAGEIVMEKVKQHRVNIMPVDSEHSALYQCLNGERRAKVKRLILTCSGGALRDKKNMENVTISEALGHKTWNMGQKITIDSATLMNKGFEVIEAMWLYDMPVKKIDVVIHKESIIHSMVEYSDHSVIAQMSPPDMRLPIQYALSYPDRWEASINRLDFSKNLSFDKPDLKRFPCLSYAYEAAGILGTMPAAMNAANDYMVLQFLRNKCKYLDIHRVIRQVMDSHKSVKKPDLEDIENAVLKSTRAAEKLK